MSERGRVIEVPKGMAEALRNDLASLGLVDGSRKISKRADSVLIPVTTDPPLALASYRASLVGDVQLPPRIRPWNLRTKIREALQSANIPLDAAPQRWRRIGDILVIRIPPRGRRHARAVAETYGQVLGGRTVVEDRSGIHGPLRTPDVRILWGNGTETIHTEAGVRYRLDVARVMLSSGNLAERIGISDRVRPDAVVVDLFAGIGYFSLPIAVRCRPSAVYACELNPVSFSYLQDNIRMNRADTVIPLFGDCRETAPRGVADWVLMGHFDARDYLDVAFRCLRRKGTIVYHEICPREHVPERPIGRVAEAARANWMQPVRIAHRIVKSYAPGIVHVVVEARVESTIRHP